MVLLTATGKQKVKQRAGEQVSPSQARAKVNQDANCTWQMPVWGCAWGREAELEGLGWAEGKQDSERAEQHRPG